MLITNSGHQGVRAENLRQNTGKTRKYRIILVWLILGATFYRSRKTEKSMVTMTFPDMKGPKREILGPDTPQQILAKSNLAYHLVLLSGGNIYIDSENLVMGVFFFFFLVSVRFFNGLRGNCPKIVATVWGTCGTGHFDRNEKLLVRKQAPYSSFEDISHPRPLWRRGLSKVREKWQDV